MDEMNDTEDMDMKDAMMKMGMPMEFYNSKCVRLLWKGFHSCNDPDDISQGGTSVYYALLAFVIALAVLIEVLNYYRFIGLHKMCEDGAYWGRDESG